MELLHPLGYVLERMEYIMEHTPIRKLLLKLAPPVMLSLLIQSVYNIVDSYFVASYSSKGFLALSIIFPIQLLMTALATGTGVGINILISKMDGEGKRTSQDPIVKTGLFAGILNAIVFAILGSILIHFYYEISSDLAIVRNYGISYAQIIFILSPGLFIESICTKIHQAKGNMILPMIALVSGALINVVLDPVLIFGLFGLPTFGIRGAASATVLGQWISMLIVLIPVIKRYDMKAHISKRILFRIYQLGFPSIIMQSLYTLYIVGLNLILKLFSEDAVTALGIYYKLQTFFFIPLFGLQQVIVPMISYNHAAKKESRVSQILHDSLFISYFFMLVGILAFFLFPDTLMRIFHADENVLLIGKTALRIISLSFLPGAYNLIYAVYFQGINRGMDSLKVTILRQILLFVPLAWLLHYKGLFYVWFTFPLTETITSSYCFYLKKIKVSKKRIMPDQP